MIHGRHPRVLELSPWHLEGRVIRVKSPPLGTRYSVANRGPKAPPTLGTVEMASEPGLTVPGGTAIAGVALPEAQGPSIRVTAGAD